MVDFQGHCIIHHKLVGENTSFLVCSALLGISQILHLRQHVVGEGSRVVVLLCRWVNCILHVDARVLYASALICPRAIKFQIFLIFVLLANLKNPNPRITHDNVLINSLVMRLYYNRYYFQKTLPTHIHTSRFLQTAQYFQEHFRPVR